VYAQYFNSVNDINIHEKAEEHYNNQQSKHTVLKHVGTGMKICKYTEE